MTIDSMALSEHVAKNPRVCHRLIAICVLIFHIFVFPVRKDKTKPEKMVLLAECCGLNSYKYLHKPATVFFQWV